VELVVQPTTGDVLRLEMQQVIEMSAARRDGRYFPDASLGAGSAREIGPQPAVGPRRNATPTRVTIMDFVAHSTVERSDESATVLATVPDSLIVRTGEIGQALTSQRVPLPVSAQPTRIRVAANGAMSMLDAGAEAAAVGATLSAMPAMLPDEAVFVGDTWERDVEMPPLPLAAYRADGRLHAVFRLDSMRRGGRDAYVSVRGELRRDGAGRELPPGSRVVTAGTMTGTLTLDRDRGWIVDARTTIEMHSAVVGAESGGAPMELGIRISQRMRVR
jgi:hypothetical protein